MAQTETITIQYTLGAETSYQAIKPKDYEKVKAKLGRLGYVVKKIYICTYCNKKFNKR